MKKTTTPATPTEYENLDPVLGQEEVSAASNVSAASDESEIPKPYPGKQQDLYAYARNGWRNYLAHQAVFGKFAPMIYTLAFGEEQLAFIEMTKNLPDQEARVVEPLDAKDDLYDLNKAVLDLFMDGTFYIERTWTEPVKQSMMLKAAGINYFTKAGDRNWTSSESLISAFLLFLTDYGAELEAANWMPKTFPDTFRTASAPFLSLLDDYKAKWEAARTKRSVKATNNNLIYKTLSEMCEVGKRKFSDNATNKKKFTITALLDEVAGHSDSGFQGLCAINGNKRYPVQNVRLSATVDGEERVTISGENGRYFLPLPSGTDYTVKMEAAGYLPQTFVKSVKIGIKSYLNWTMVREEVPVVSASPAIEAAPSMNLSKMVENVVKKAENGVK